MPPLDLKYPKRCFGNGPERSFCKEWYRKFPWLHYDEKRDVNVTSGSLGFRHIGPKKLPENHSPMESVGLDKEILFWPNTPVK